MGALATLAKMLGLSDENAADDAMRSERVYRATLSRRSLLAAGAALATGKAFVPSAELVLPGPLIDPWSVASIQLMMAATSLSSYHRTKMSLYAKANR